MQIDLIIKIAAIGFLVAVAHQVLTRAGREDIAAVVTVAGLSMALLMVLDVVAGLFSSVRTLFGLF